VGLDEVQPLEPVERAVHVGNLRQLGELLAADRCASEEAQHEKQVLLVGRKRGLDALDDRGVRIVGLDVGSRSFSGFWVSRAYAASSRILSGFPRSLTLIVSATACSSTVSWRPSSFSTSASASGSSSPPSASVSSSVGTASRVPMTKRQSGISQRRYVLPTGAGVEVDHSRRVGRQRVVCFVRAVDMVSERAGMAPHRARKCTWTRPLQPGQLLDDRAALRADLELDVDVVAGHDDTPDDVAGDDDAPVARGDPLRRHCLPPRAYGCARSCAELWSPMTTEPPSPVTMPAFWTLPAT
jgi:hypothetical protein